MYRSPSFLRPRVAAARGRRLLIFFFVAITAIAVVPGLTASLGAQEMRTLRADEALILREIGAICEPADDGLRVAVAFPRDGRPEAYRNVDVRQGDRLIAMNGKRLRDLETARTLYDEAKPGEEIALGLERGGTRKIVRFPKADPDELPDRMTFGGHGPGGGRAMMLRTEVGGGGPMVPVPGLGVVLTEGDGGSVRVAVVLPGVASVLREGDAVQSIEGRSVGNAATASGIVEEAAVGASLAVVVERDGERLELRQEKSEARFRMEVLEEDD